MKNWRQKLSIDLPCALGDWLWAMFVVEIARLLDKITRRRLLHVIGFLILLYFFDQVVALDLTFLFGVDLGLLMEVAAALFVLALHRQGKAVIAVARHQWALTKPRIILAWRRCARRVRPKARNLLPPADDDGLLGALA